MEIEIIYIDYMDFNEFFCRNFRLLKMEIEILSTQ